MNWVDLFVVVMLIAAGMSGYRQGLITAALTMAGVIGGALVGIRVAPRLAAAVDSAGAKVAIGVLLLIAGVALGQLIGRSLGSMIVRRLRWRPVQAVDRGLGIVGQMVAALIVTWMVALPLAAIPAPWLSSQIRSSAVLAGIDVAMPESADGLSRELRGMFLGADFPEILSPLMAAPDTPTAPPDAALAGLPAIAAAQPSVVKIYADAPQCAARMTGSGFVAATEVVVTNAHVVAGADRVEVETAGQRLRADVVVYEPDVDIAVLRVAGLAAPPLPLSTDRLAAGDGAVAVGYPLGGPFTVAPMRVRATMALRGPNIYGSAPVVRQVYTLRGSIRPGNSGGPLMTPDGQVVGVVFGAAVDNPDVGFALTMEQAAPYIQQGVHAATPVGTLVCAGR